MFRLDFQSRKPDRDDYFDDIPPLGVVDAERRVPDTENIRMLRVTPNPAWGTVFIQAGQDMDNLRIYNIRGREIARPSLKAAGDFRWNAAEIPAGLYVIKAECYGRTMARRIAVIK